MQFVKKLYHNASLSDRARYEISSSPDPIADYTELEDIEFK
jgi:hypothetical protein